MKKALVSQEFYLKKLKEIFEQEKSILDQKISEVENRLNELPKEIPAVHLNQLLDDTKRKRSAEDWFNIVKDNMYAEIQHAREVDSGERMTEGALTSWVIEVNETPNL